MHLILEKVLSVGFLHIIIVMDRILSYVVRFLEFINHLHAHKSSLL